jgi:tetraacyldisaccharide 4'-kinase
MRTPSFWHKEPGVISTLLRPFGWLYGWGGKALSSFAKPHHFSVPIISVGNIVSGGSGKTPTAIALALLLHEKGINVHIVSRGYGGSLKGPLRVEPSLHNYQQVGDESLLLAHKSPTWVAKNRPLGVQAAIDQGAEMIILDDGHQTRSLYKDISFVVVDKTQGFGNGQVIPAGPLRESLREGFKRTDAFIGIGGIEIELGRQTFNAMPVFQPLKVGRVVAFCGLGFPQKFYNSLKKEGIDMIAKKSFPDHYVYQDKDLQKLLNLANEHQAELITTRKDWVKLPMDWQDRVNVLDIKIQFEDPQGIYKFIKSRIKGLS